MAHGVHEPPSAELPGMAQATLERHRAQLDEDFATFERLVEDSQRYADGGRDVAAAVFGTFASSFAYFRHPGIWASPDIERTLLTVGRRRTRARPPRDPRPRGEPPQRVLHVLTRVFGIGGHSRMVWRWIQQDASRSHSVVLTHQGAAPIPQLLIDAVAERDGSVHALNRRPGNVLTWAQRLRDLATTADVVVLHVFGDDALPLLAFANREGLPPVAFLDHSDHAFWLGVGASDVVIGMRDAGLRLAAERRGVDSSRQATLPIVLPALERTTARDEAKRRLGLPPESVVLLSIARAPKFHDFEGTHYAQAFLPTLQRNPNVHLLAVGPDPDAGWQRVARETAGRVQAFSERPDTARFYEAADIYVDSFPAGSNTSLLEAASYGLPLVSRCLHPDEHTILCSDAPGMSSHAIRTSDMDEWRGALEALIADPAYRERLGGQAREAVIAAHTGAGWQAQLERFYAFAASVPQLTGLPTGVDSPRHEQLDLLWSHLFRGPVTLDQVQTWNLKRLPLDLRLRMWTRLLLAGRPAGPQLLLPEWTTSPLRELLDAAGASARRVRARS